MYRNILDFFEETVSKNADKKALLHKEDSLTFKELRCQSRAMANYIYSKNNTIGNKPIAVFLPKSIDVYVCDIAITYASAFFSNLDIKTPIDRIEAIIRNMDPVLIITDKKNSEYFAGIADYSDKLICVDVEDWKNCNAYETQIDARLNKQIDTDPFCIINTSGSTGVPKGVVLNHKSFIDFMFWSFDTFEFDGSEIVGALSPVVFDIYDYELCLMMLKGSSVVLLDASLGVFPAKLLQEMVAKKVSFIFWVPTIMVNIANMGLLEKIPLTDLKTVWFAGEVFPTKQFNIWRKNLPNVSFSNLYGPIEITLDCLYYTVDREFSDNEPLPIGIPCFNTDILLLNEKDELCANGEEGEICVRGTSLAMGYYNNPEKTAAAFTLNPIQTAYPELIYRTGDIGVVEEDGLVYFKGRRDSLIKHMGYRIELGEIEHIVVNTLKLFSNCCVVYNRAEKEITLIYEGDAYINEAEVKKTMALKMPKYMVPTKFVRKDLMPRNTNGKIDRLSLAKEVNGGN